MEWGQENGPLNALHWQCATPAGPGPIPEAGNFSEIVYIIIMTNNFLKKDFAKRQKRIGKE